MKLRKLLGLQAEVGDNLKRYSNEFEVICFHDVEELSGFLVESKQKDRNEFKKGLLIAATDETIALGKQYGIAAMAYMNLEIPNQTYSGVDMIVEGFEEIDANFLEKVYQRYHGIPWTIAETDRCIIRELSLEDLDALFELYADEEMIRFTENLYPYEEEQEFQSAYINNMYRFYGYGMWLIFSKETDELIGRAGLEHREYNGEIELELGYLIGRKYQKQGYATEVCQKILRIAKSMTDFSRINCLIDAENVSSARLAEKLHFTHTEDMELDGRKMERYILMLD
ncbi:MAG: GNAT family N-acetyltransferase [Agathobacter sp.]|nr:GNAT family N-acetyltransferase [Agathobacter sp.]